MEIKTLVNAMFKWITIFGILILSTKAEVEVEECPENNEIVLKTNSTDHFMLYSSAGNPDPEMMKSLSCSGQRMERKTDKQTNDYEAMGFLFKLHKFCFRTKFFHQVEVKFFLDEGPPLVKTFNGTGPNLKVRKCIFGRFTKGAKMFSIRLTGTRPDVSKIQMWGVKIVGCKVEM